MRVRNLGNLVFAMLVSAAVAREPMVRPKYGEGNELRKPEGYRNWRFVAANYGMGYREGPGVKAAPGTFHNIFIQPEALEEYASTGIFPDRTMLVMEIFKPGTKSSINKQGMFQDQFVGIEVALKDSSRFAEKWAYFKFFNDDGTEKSQAKAFPKEACWNCHNEHGAADNVFVQFYPPLRDRRSK